MQNNTSIYLELSQFIKELKPEDISNERKNVLNSLAKTIQQQASKNEQIRLNFICTHNSRRSHLAQIWAQTLALYFNLKNFYCYSGGTEATALFPMVVETLRKAGFKIQQLSEGKNPIYSIKYGENVHPVIGFSKKIEDDFNPKSDFIAIMTCDSANEACPVVFGADERIPITFKDPKVFDNTPEQAEKYQERSLQIATEMCYVFNQLNV